MVSISQGLSCPRDCRSDRQKYRQNDSRQLRRKLRLFFTSLLVSVGLLNVAAQANATHHVVSQVSVVQNSAQSLYRLSGLHDLIEQIPTSTASSFESALTVDRLPEIFTGIDQNLIRSAVHNAFKMETFDRYMVKELSSSMDNAARLELLAWYATDLGERVRQAELANSLLSEQNRFIEFQNYLNRYPASEQREQIVQGLDETMRSTESAVDMMINIQVAFNLSLSPFMPEEQRLSRQDILDMVKGQEQQLLEHYKQQTKEVLLFTYQDLSDDELKKLDSTLSTDAGQAFVSAINDGIKKGMFAASLDLGDGLGALIQVDGRNQGI